MEDAPASSIAVNTLKLGAGPINRHPEILYTILNARERKTGEKIFNHADFFSVIAARGFDAG